jgi:hypothetical protein
MAGVVARYKLFYHLKTVICDLNLATLQEPACGGRCKGTLAQKDGGRRLLAGGEEEEEDGV